MAATAAAAAAKRPVSFKPTDGYRKPTLLCITRHTDTETCTWRLPGFPNIASCNMVQTHIIINVAMIISSRQAFTCSL
jgi:hypothetical protein